jgi:EmrB/QacA subfamily drug resistance transporter
MTAPVPPPITDKDRRSIVIGALVSMFLAALDQTIMSPALPTIGAQLGDAAWLSWVISAYFLTATAVTPLYGKLADIKGRRPVLFSAVGIFLVGSVICAVAPSMAALIIGRAIQGVGGGGLMALAQTIIGDVVPPKERSRYVVFITGVWATASIAGPVVGGVFAQHVHWSLIFWINLPIGLVAIVLTERALRKLPVVHRDHALDWLGSVLVVLATVALMFALTLGGTRFPWGSTEILALIGASALLFAGFALHLGRAPEPLIPPRVMRNPVIAPTVTGLFFAMGASVGLSVYFPVYLELVEGFDAASAGFALVGFMVGTVAGANTSGRMMAHTPRYKRIGVAGGVMAAVAFATLAAAVGTAPFWLIEVLIFIGGFGNGTQFPVTTVSVQNAAEPRDLGTATSTMSFMRSLGSVVGVATLGAILIGTGVVENIGEAAAGRHATDAASIAAAVDAFRWLFGFAAIAQLVAVGFLSLAEERPLRGRAPVHEPSE